MKIYILLRNFGYLFRNLSLMLPYFVSAFAANRNFPSFLKYSEHGKLEKVKNRIFLARMRIQSKLLNSQKITFSTFNRVKKILNLEIKKKYLFTVLKIFKIFNFRIHSHLQRFCWGKLNPNRI